MTKSFYWLLAAAAFALPSCQATTSPEQLYRAGKPLPVPVYKAGVTEGQRQADITSCQVVAAQQVPQNMQLSTTPTFTTPAYTTCNQVGWTMICNTTGGNTVGGQVSSYDANADLRNRVVSMCLSRRGYGSAQIAPCPAGKTPMDLGTSILKLPQLTNRTCYIVQDGRTYIGILRN